MRNLKVLSLALVAAFAFSALAASAASATNHHFNGTVGQKLESAAITANKFEATTGEGKGYECSTVGVNGEVKEATATAVTVEPLYSKCATFNPAGAADVRENGCHYKFTGATTSGNPTGGEHATVHLECPVGATIEIRVTGLNLKCSSIGSQEVADAVRYENVETPGGNKHIRINATAHGIDSTTEGACGSGTHDNGGYTGDVTVTSASGVSTSAT